jgi:hypothetical protein
MRRGRVERPSIAKQWRRVAALLVLTAAAAIPSTPARAQTSAAAQNPSGAQRPRDPLDDKPDAALVERTHREEGEAILALADAALAGKPAPSDFAVTWQNDFVKAQRGTFVPFTLTVDTSRFTRPAALVYVRALRSPKRPASEPRRDQREPPDFAVDAIFPVELERPAAGVDRAHAAPSRISRGFSVEPGDYDVFVVMRERVEPGGAGPRPVASVLRQPLVVPEFGSSELTTSTLILADRLTPLAEAVPADRLAERPYAIGLNEITPAADRRFRRDEELIVVFLVYNPTVTSERQFDLKVEYHFFWRSGSRTRAGEGDAAHHPARPGETYFNRTEPQRFNPALMGPSFDPRNGEPVMAGQVVPLAGFEDGEYRLDVQVTDLLTGKTVSRDVMFTVGS